MKFKSENRIKSPAIGSDTKQVKSGRDNSWLPFLVFFSISFMYFCFFANYIFTYQEKKSLFLFTNDFLRENLTKPGGFLVYISIFLSSFYYYIALGAFILSALLTFIVRLSSRVIFLFSGKRNTVIPLTTGILLFAMQTDYRSLLFNIIGFLFVILLMLIVAKHPDLLHGWFPVIFLPLVYYFTGGFIWIALLFLTVYLIISNVEKRWLKLVVAVALMTLTIFLSLEFLIFQNDKTIYFYPLSELNIGLHTLIFSLVTFLMIFLPALARIRYPAVIKARINAIKANSLAALITLVVMLPICVGMFDSKNKQYFYTEKLFFEGKFTELINFSKKIPPTNSLSVFLNNVALCETGQLDDHLFNTIQSPDGNTLFLKWEMFVEVLKRGGYFYYAAGMINEAHRWAFENMVMKGLSPEDLKMLVETELINGNYNMASKYITLLGKTIFYRKEAAHFRKFLNNDSAVDADNELGYKKKNRVKRDFFSISDDPLVNLEMMLAGGSVNKEALQYYCANLLLKKDYKGITRVLPEFEKAGFTKLPVNLEEAAEAISLMNKGQLPFTGNIPISKETEARWNQFLTIFGQYNTDVKAAEPALRKEFGNTFWYYAFYR